MSYREDGSHLTPPAGSRATTPQTRWKLKTPTESFQRTEYRLVQSTPKDFQLDDNRGSAKSPIEIEPPGGRSVQWCHQVIRSCQARASQSWRRTRFFVPAPLGECTLAGVPVLCVSFRGTAPRIEGVIGLQHSHQQASTSA